MKTQTCTPIETPFSPKEELRLVQQELETARCHFNMAEDSDLIDCCIHQLTALEKRQNYLLRLLRHSGVSLPSPAVLYADSETPASDGYTFSSI